MARSSAPGAGSVDPADHPPIAFADESWAYFCERLQALNIPLSLPMRLCDKVLRRFMDISKG